MRNVDFYISSNGYLIIPKFNIKYLINLSESNIPSMPEAVESIVEIPGKDGDITLSTNYKPIMFEIVCYTNDGLTQAEKVAAERNINMFLNSIKNKKEKMGIEKDNKFYEVKYNGALTTINNPGFMQFNIPLKSSDSYAKDLEEKSITGDASLISDTIKEVGAIFTIKGPAQKPKISLNNYIMFYNSSLLENQELEINSRNSTITHINNVNGKRTNAMRYYNHQFPKIENGNNELKILSGIENPSQVSVKWNDLKL